MFLAEDGLAGVAAVESADPPFDIIFMDCQMPRMDGVGRVCFRFIICDLVGISSL